MGWDIVEQREQLKPQIGVVFDCQNLYQRMSGRDNLLFYARLYGVRKRRVDELLDRVGLTERARDRTQDYSNGMKQRLLIARGLLHEPKVLFLDEPTRGLDPNVAREIRAIISDLGQQGITVFLTTHNLAEAEELAEEVAILIQGRIVARGTVAELRARVGKARGISVTFSAGLLPQKLEQSCPSVRKAVREGVGFHLQVSGVHDAILELVDLARREGMRIEELACASPSLEEVFLDIVRSGEGGKEGGA